MPQPLRIDPRGVPIDSVGDEPPVAPERLQVPWIEKRFAHPPTIWTPERFSDRRLYQDKDLWVPAAVVIPIVDRPGAPSLLLTQRTEHLQHHPGQISFPGGRIEAEDASPADAALREMEEEVGVSREHAKVIGTLPEYRTGTGYIITPIVSIVTPPFGIQTDPFEVAEAFEVPLSHLMNGAHFQRRIVDLPNQMGKQSFYSIPFNNKLIWGATAGILRNLFHFLRA